MVKNPNYKIIDDAAILENLRINFESEIAAAKIPDNLANPEFVGNDRLKMEVATRMIFSSLVDADFLDTEKHYQNGRERSPLLLNDELLQTLLEKLENARTRKADEARAKNADENLIAIRNSIYQNCLQKATESPGFFSLTVPTGGAKTLAAMAFALKHALYHDLRRVIVVIPYLSIIEQNAKDYREILGEEIVIENHSSVVIKEDKTGDYDEQSNPLALAAENWDAPVIVTTSVQFIESLFSHKPSRCRKLHNIAPLNLFLLAKSTVREAKDLQPEVPTQLYRAALEDHAPSPAVAKGLLDRIAVDLAKDGKKSLGNLSRFGLLRLVINRNEKENEKMIGENLDTKITDEAYNCGRLLAVFEELQAAYHEYKLEGASVVEKYYGTAASSPNSAFGILWRLHQHHLKKVARTNRGKAEAIKQKIAEISTSFKTPHPPSAPQFPRSFNLQQQGRFALGFYQQIAADKEAREAYLKNKKSEKNTGEQTI